MREKVRAIRNLFLDGAITLVEAYVQLVSVLGFEPITAIAIIDGWEKKKDD